MAARHLTIAVCHPSPVISYGLVRMLSQLREYSLSVSALDPSALGGFLAHNVTDIVILDPVATGNNPKFLVPDNAPRTPVFVGITAISLPKNLYDSYDFILSIYDNQQAFRDILRKCTASNESTEQPIELSPREKDVVIGVVKGLSNKEIASEMNVSTNTVMTHRRNIASKLQIHSVAGLTIYAIVSKLVRLEELHQS